VTKPARPGAVSPESKVSESKVSEKAVEKVVEIDAIDLDEWERDRHTPQAPAAGLAALVRQTVSPPLAEATQRPQHVEPSPRPQRAQTALPRAQTAAPRAPTAQPISRRQPPRPPPAAIAEGSASRTPLPLAAESLLPFEVEPPTAPVVPFDAAAAARSPQPLAPQAPAFRMDSVPLPLIAPPSAPISSPSQLIAPEQIAARDALRALPDQASLSAVTGRTGSSDILPSRDAIRPAGAAATGISQPSGAGPGDVADRSPAPDLTARFASLRMVLIVGASITVVAVLLSVLLLADSDPPAAPQSTVVATAAAASAAAVPPPSPAPASAPRPPPGTAAVAVAPAPPRAQVPEPRTQRPEQRTQRPEPRIQRTEPRTQRPEQRTQRPGPRGAPAPRTVRRPAALEASQRDELRAELAAAAAIDAEPAVAQARTAYASGNELLFDGNFTAAIDAYRRAVGHAPKYAAGYRGLGLAYAQQGNSAAAVKAFRTYLTLAPQARDVALIKRRIAALQSGVR
jgi:Tetratricopeptide repeat